MKLITKIIIGAVTAAFIWQLTGFMPMIIAAITYCAGFIMGFQLNEDNTSTPPDDGFNS